jgi:hypothetical protein
VFRHFSRAALSSCVLWLLVSHSPSFCADFLQQTLSQPNNSVFTIQRDGAIQDGCADKQPNDQSIDISIIQFNDDGSFAKPRQLQAALSCITHARRENPNGALVVLLIHGWHHSASWNTRTNKGDSNFAEFRRVLMTLALREAERYVPGPAGRRVVGVYIGWNGDPTKGMLSHMNEILSFWNRYKVATRIAQSSNIRQALGAVIDQTKETLDSKVTAQSPLVMIGHSMGAMFL